MQRTDTHWHNCRLAVLGIFAACAVTGCDELGVDGPDDAGDHHGGTGGEHDGGTAGGPDGGTGGSHDAGLRDADTDDAALHDAALHDAGLRDAALHDAAAGDAGARSDASGDAGLCCEAEAICEEGEESYGKLETCEAAGEGCYESSICCSTVYCRPSECPGAIAHSKDGCSQPDDSYCYPLPSGEYCTGARGSCDVGARPIPTDQPCPEGHFCSEQADGAHCAMRSFESTAACLEVGDYATAPIGAVVPCDAGDITLGGVQGFEPSLCCLDPQGNKAACEAMSASSVGDCEKLLGWTWNGNSCVSLSGCSCEGSDCDGLFSSPMECEDALRERQCLPPDCRTTGCPAGDVCQICWAGYACVPKGAVC